MGQMLYTSETDVVRREHRMYLMHYLFLHICFQEVSVCHWQSKYKYSYKLIRGAIAYLLLAVVAQPWEVILIGTDITADGGVAVGALVFCIKVLIC